MASPFYCNISLNLRCHQTTMAYALLDLMCLLCQSLPPPSILHAVKLSSKDKIVSLNHFQLGPQEGINTKAIVQTPKHMDITTYSQKHLTCFTFHGLLYLSLTANIFKNVFLKSSKLMTFLQIFSNTNLDIQLTCFQSSF